MTFAVGPVREWDDDGPFVLLERPAWMADAACRGLDTELFFPSQGTQPPEAKETCAGCPVRAECLDYAIDNVEMFGVWGGMSEKQRKRVRRQRRAA